MITIFGKEYPTYFNPPYDGLYRFELSNGVCFEIVLKCGGEIEIPIGILKMYMVC